MMTMGESMNRGVVTMKRGHSRVVVVASVDAKAMIAVTRQTPEPPDPLSVVYSSASRLPAMFHVLQTRNGFEIVATRFSDEWRMTEDVDLVWWTA